MKLRINLNLVEPKSFEVELPVKNGSLTEDSVMDMFFKHTELANAISVCQPENIVCVALDDNIYLQSSEDISNIVRHCREQYLNNMQNLEMDEEPVRPGQVIVDFMPYSEDGDYSSYVDNLEAEGVRVIHTDRYSSIHLRNQYDVDRSGTTGHAQRASDNDVLFKTFECPFGLDKHSRLTVDTAAEISLYYEKALRGEIDWNALIDDLIERGNISELGNKEKADLINDLQSQFAWMREEIMSNPTLKNCHIVADSLVAPDLSMGYSLYDSFTAPCPAQILARYINNPKLFYSKSRNGVMNAIEADRHDDYTRFSTMTGKGTVDILVFGSDTIGGRVPGTKSSKKKVDVYMKDENGGVYLDRHMNKLVTGSTMKYVATEKTLEEKEADYSTFSARLEKIISNIQESVKIRFITGNDIGIPRMVRRFVQEHSGKISYWDYYKSMPVEYKGQDSAGESRFSQLLMSHFGKIFPVLAQAQNSVTFSMKLGDSDTDVYFQKNMLKPQCAIACSVAKDLKNNVVLRQASLAITNNIPLIHVRKKR